MKMPEPIIDPATIVVASRSPSRRGSVRRSATAFAVVDIGPPAGSPGIVLALALDALDSHPVEGAVDEDDGHEEEGDGERGAHRAGEADGELDGEEAEERR